MKILYIPNQYSQQRQKEKPVWIYPVRLAMEAEFRRFNNEVHWWEGTGYYLKKKDWDMIITEPEGLPFLKLPPPDRFFTDALNPKYQVYGNYKYLPATHMQVADGCWWGKCEFCVERKKEYEIRDVDEVIDEIKECERQGFREIFDDSGTFPTGKWLEQFCIKKACFVPDIVMGCNMRMCEVDFKLMRAANFRMVLFGIESRNQKTLNRINKGVDFAQFIKILKDASRAGLEPHGAFMFGFPWESEREELETLKFIHYLLKRGLLHTAQASVYDIGQGRIDRGNVRNIYNAAYSFEFWFRKLIKIRDMEDIRYLLKQIRKGIKRD